MQGIPMFYPLEHTLVDNVEQKTKHRDTTIQGTYENIDAGVGTIILF